MKRRVFRYVGSTRQPKENTVKFPSQEEVDKFAASLHKAAKKAEKASWAGLPALKPYKFDKKAADKFAAEQKRERLIPLVAQIAAAIQTHEKIIIGPHGMRAEFAAKMRRERIRERVETALLILKEAERQVK